MYFALLLQIMLNISQKLLLFMSKFGKKLAKKRRNAAKNTMT